MLAFRSVFVSKHTRVFLQFSAITVFFTLGVVGCVFNPLTLNGFPCTPEGLCADGEVCVKGICYKEGEQPKPDCSKDSDCAGGCSLKCDKEVGKCKSITCVDASDCGCGYKCNPKTSTCVETIPNQCQKASDCVSGYCKDGTCSDCTEDAQCPSTGLCKGKRCVQCVANAECSSNFCDSGVCRPCAQNKDCTNTLFCNAEKVCAKCEKDADCDSNNCDKVDGVCQQNCTQGSDCPSGICRTGRCEPCTKAEDCPNLRCVNARCAPPTPSINTKSRTATQRVTPWEL